MYSSPDDARSDLFLAGAVFLFGGIIFQILLDIVPLGRLPVVGELLVIAQPVVTTALVPYLLIRYRQEPWSAYGFGSRRGGVWSGALLALPIVAAMVAARAVLGGDPLTELPLVATTSGDAVVLLARVAQLGSLTFLGVFGAVKARDAFRGEYRTLRDGAWEIMRILGAVVAAGAVLSLLTVITRIDPAGLVAFLLPAVGVVGAVAFAWSQLAGPSATVRPVLVTPTVIFGVAAFRIRLDPGALAETVYQAGLLASLGLVVGLLQEQRRSAWPAVGLAVAVAVLSTFGRVIR